MAPYRCRRSCPTSRSRCRRRSSSTRSLSSKVLSTSTRKTTLSLTLASLRDCPTDRVEQRVFVDGLPQVAGGPAVFDTLAGRGIVVGCDEDHGDARPVSHQAVVKIESAHSAVQVDVEDETGWATPAQRIEQLA